MLSVYGGLTSNVIYNVKEFFKSYYKPEWLESNIAKQMILDVDKSEVESPYCIKSYALGQISPFMLSGGVQNLLLMQNLPEGEDFWGTACGENCEKWIYEIGKHRNINIYLTNIMFFDGMDKYDTEIYFPQIDKKAVSHTEILECMSDISDKMNDMN